MKPTKYLILIILLPVVIALESTYLIIDKPVYDANEILTIQIKGSIQPEYSVAILSPNNVYRFLGIPSHTLIFRPQEPGRHIIELYDSTKLIDSINFTVKGANLIKKKRFEIYTSSRKAVDGSLRFYKDNKLIALKNIKDLPNENFYENKTYDVELIPNIKNIRKIKFKNLKIENDFELGVEDVSLQGFVKTYAIDPVKLNFTEAVVTSIAQGTSLYKCKDWNFSQQRCYGSWKKIQDIVPGQEYSFILTPQDPGYGESGELPEPHPVSGYVFHSDNITRADNGMPVRIINNDNGESVLTEVYAPPLPQYKGAYSADIYGNDGDSITVRAWNSTHYGESNTNLLSTTTYVNVTIQYERGSEPNVTITNPINNSVFNISKTIVLNATVQLLYMNGTNCYATATPVNNVVELEQGEQSTVYIGNISVNSSVTQTWNFYGLREGTTNFTVFATCDSDTEILLDLNEFTTYNITIVDQVNPEINLFSPEDNSEVTNPVQIEFNVSDHTGVENCSLILNSQINQTINNPVMYIKHTFNLTLDAGTYNWSIGCYDNSSYYNYNQTETQTFILPSWHFYYGNLSTKIALSNVQNQSEYIWPEEAEANIYVVETGSNIDWLSLQALGRDTSNISAFDDFYEADVNLSLTIFSDSINNTYTKNNQPKQTTSLLVYDRTILNIPIANSTNNSNFFTGILWDTTDGGTQYNGSQDLVFFTRKNLTLQGKFGVYNYEIRVPATLKNYKLNSGTVSFYVELI